jgi:hypothetical protein
VFEMHKGRPEIVAAQPDQIEISPIINR